MTNDGITGMFDVVGAAGPRTFFGHLSEGTLAHGYLFTGDEGVGKKAFALRLAQSLLCVTPKPTLLGYCGHCTGCTRVQTGTHPDVFLAEGSLKIGDRDGGSGFHESAEMTARDLVRQLSLHSYAGGKRIFILGDADFTREAANALLKFFEEPPPGVLLIITSNAPGRLLATIRSRLVDIAFPHLALAEIVEILTRGGASYADAERAAPIGQGSATRARAYLDEGQGGTRAAAIAYFYAAVRGDVADGAWATRPTLEDGVGTIKMLARDWLALAVGGSDAPLLVADQRAELARLPAADPAVLVRALAAIGEAEKIARTNVSPALVVDLVRMALAPSR